MKLEQTAIERIKGMLTHCISTLLLNTSYRIILVWFFSHENKTLYSYNGSTAILICQSDF